MMGFTEKLLDFAGRKERLIARAAQQRAEIAAAVLRWDKPISVLDRGLAAARFLKEHPLVVVAASTAVIVLGRRNLLRWTGRGLIAWRAWRSVNAWTRRVDM